MAGPNALQCATLTLLALATSSAVAQLFSSTTDAECPSGWTTVDNSDDAVSNLTQTAFLVWLDNASPSAPNISCDGNTTTSYDITIYAACQQEATYEVLLEADFSCNYNQTPYFLPDISDPNAVLNDTVYLDAQVLTSSSSDDVTGSEVNFVDLLYAYEDYPYYDY